MAKPEPATLPEQISTLVDHLQEAGEHSLAEILTGHRYDIPTIDAWVVTATTVDSDVGVAVAPVSVHTDKGDALTHVHLLRTFRQTFNHALTLLHEGWTTTRARGVSYPPESIRAWQRLALKYCKEHLLGGERADDPTNEMLVTDARLVTFTVHPMPLWLTTRKGPLKETPSLSWVGDPLIESGTTDDIESDDLNEEEFPASGPSADVYRDVHAGKDSLRNLLSRVEPWGSAVLYNDLIEWGHRYHFEPPGQVLQVLQSLCGISSDEDAMGICEALEQMGAERVLHLLSNWNDPLEIR